MESIVASEIIFYIALIILVLILIILILLVLVYILLKKSYSVQKTNRQNYDAEDISFFVSDNENSHNSEETKRKDKNSNSVELQKHPSAYIFLNNQKKIRINSEEFFVGFSKANDLVISEPGVSQTHCKIKSTGNEFYLFDLISQTGTFLNGKKLLRTRELNDWDEIRIGNTLLVFRKIQYI